jgi:hypothetical protein
MTTATKKLTEAQYEIPRGVKYASLHKRNDVYAEIFERYAPYVPLSSLTPAQSSSLSVEGVEPTIPEHPKHRCKEALETAKALKDDAGKSPAPLCPHQIDLLIADPECIYVGRLIDGLVSFGVFNTRRLAKNFLNNIPAGTTFREPGIAGQFTGGGVVEMSFQAVEPRQEMYAALEKGAFSNQPQVEDLIRSGVAPTINMGTIIKDAEPGEILNSPDIVTTDTSIDDETDMWEAGQAEIDFSPRIRLDNRFGLHYLKRGDTINIKGVGWPRPRVQEFEHTWVLKPMSEGPSLVQRDPGGNEIIQLSNMRA